MKQDPVERLLAKIDRRGDNECWPWKGGIFTFSGYGRFWLNGKRTNAHRAVIHLLCGMPLTDDRRRRWPGKDAAGAKREVRHLCNNRICCNPAHLSYDTHVENTRDYVATNYYKNARQRFTFADYSYIRNSSEDNAALAKRFGTSRTHIWRIRKGKHTIKDTGN